MKNLMVLGFLTVATLTVTQIAPAQSADVRVLPRPCCGAIDQHRRTAGPAQQEQTHSRARRLRTHGGRHRDGTRTRPSWMRIGADDDHEGVSGDAGGHHR